MTDPTIEIESITPGWIREHCPEIVRELAEAAREEGRTAGFDAALTQGQLEGIAYEHGRVAQIRALGMPGTAEVVAECVADVTVALPEAVDRIAAAAMEGTARGRGDSGATALQ